MLGVICNNVTNNKTLMKELEDPTNALFSMNTQVRCFACVLNLIVKATISIFVERNADVAAPLTVTQDADTMEEAVDTDNTTFSMDELADKEEEKKSIVNVRRQSLRRLTLVPMPQMLLSTQRMT